ncbi:MAG: hypothetical protein A3A27_02160 [Candidatus Wildermuthbacteria bacterium RIFCSPLOWO2_01_FULL_47_18]|uniref:PKD domain-containing protein n=1 Tax=Candidatus Wildermuthbacteria bacterium RIFCSPLOWO2_01_FULL_47_18 TaxID=1802460 RepID=A0A1G2RKM2_9BACT|nr:MAG: hypothetical protein A3A27_02160 [Candidatus Wildermuthbacteria bacterium RIFCSPLOWO2_01_FULL_47_18]OHB18153.1 MAG: hypothetical protein A2749_02830 [Parcubacteria group bacterium RIFCSPHIGHO2_01_FULL_45_26]
MSRKARKIIPSLLFLLPFFPFSTHAQVIVNEVAWMGTAQSSSNEWIELSNTSDSSVNLLGWVLEWATDTSSPKTIELSGSIGPNGHYLLERTDDTTVPGINADAIYAGALSNSGEKLRLRSPSSIIQTLDFISGWPAGDNESKDTMQWSSSKWVTAQATPKAKNIGEMANPEQQKQNMEATSTTIVGTGSAIPGESRTLALNIGRDKIVSTDSLINFNSAVSPRSSEATASIVWSFGDGAKSGGFSPSHVYVFPGSYVVTARAYSGREYAEARLIVRVLAQDVKITEVRDGNEGYVLIKNNSSTEQKLDYFGLSSGSQLYIFPEMFSLLPLAEIKIPARVSGLTDFPKGDVTLRNPEGTIISRLTKESPAVLETFSVPTKTAPNPDMSRAITSLNDIRVGVLALQTESKKQAAEEKDNKENKDKKEFTRLEIPRKISLFTKIISIPRQILASVISSI